MNPLPTEVLHVGLLAVDPNHGQTNLLLDGIQSIYKTEGFKGLYRGTSLALFGVTNGAIQFMCYEELKRWGFERKRRQFVKAGREWTPSDDKLVSVRVIQSYVPLMFMLVLSLIPHTR